MYFARRGQVRFTWCRSEGISLADGPQRSSGHSCHSISVHVKRAHFSTFSFEQKRRRSRSVGRGGDDRTDPPHSFTQILQNTAAREPRSAPRESMITKWTCIRTICGETGPECRARDPFSTYHIYQLLLSAEVLRESVVCLHPTALPY